MNPQQPFSKNQSRETGLVSFMVVSIIVVLLTLISIGFSRLMNRELRQALDRQLSAQAYYAAESGINDARVYLSKYPNSAVSVPNSCKPPPTPGGAATEPDPQFKQNLSGDGAVKYSCLSINTKPKELVYSIDTGDSIIFKLPASAAGSRRLYLGWQKTQYTGVPEFFSGIFGSLPKESALTANTTGLLRLTVYPISGASAACPATPNPNDKLSCDSRTYFLYPNATSGASNNKTYTVSAPSGDAGNGDLVAGNCTATAASLTSNTAAVAKRYCNSYIRGLPTASMYVRVTAVYSPLSVAIQDTNNPATGQAQAQEIAGVQAVIDSTGTGTDVLRRLQTRVSQGDFYYYPQDALSSMMGICKRLRLPITSPGVYGPAQTSETDPSCTIP